MKSMRPYDYISKEEEMAETGNVTFYGPDNSVLTVPVRFLPTINPPQRWFRDESSGVTAGLLLAVHTMASGDERQAMTMMDDEEHRCGNEYQRYGIGPRPHWTDMLSALAEYGASLPVNSNQHAAAFALCTALIGAKREL
jgi:hypothetical protein